MIWNRSGKKVTSRYRKALKFFNLEMNDEFLEYQKDSPNGMFSKLNENMRAINEAVLKAEKFDEIKEINEKLEKENELKRLQINQLMEEHERYEKLKERINREAKK